MKRFLSLFLLLALLLPLCGCGRAREADDISGGEMTEGWIPSEIPFPEDFSNGSRALTWADGVLYLAGKDEQGHCIAAYDTLNDSWSRMRFDQSGLLEYASVNAISVADGMLWGLLWNTGREAPEIGNYLLFGPVGGELSRVPIGFEAEHNTESSSLVFNGIFALDAERAVLYDYANGYLVDRQAGLLRTLPGEWQFGSWSKGMGRCYLGCWENGEEGCRLLEPEKLSFGPVLPVSVAVQYASDAGRLLCTDEANGSALCAFDPDSGERTRLFDWIDVALDTASLGGYYAFENERGEIFYPAWQGIVKVVPGMVRVKTPLIFAAPYKGNLYMDAILYFNNTDPEYKIVLQDMTPGEGADDERQLIQLATQGGVDIIDTSLLPDTALDGGVLADLLPFIDADPELSREEFIEPLLKSMLRGGGLYELQPRFTMLSFATHAELYPGREAWTIDYVNQLIAGHPEMPVFFWHRDRAVLADMLVKMSTAEFIDYDSAVCHFDDPRFAQWLRFVRDLPYAGGVEDYVDGPVLLHPEADVAGDIGYFCRSFLRDEDYVNCGFPSTEGNGSYFLPYGVGSGEAGTDTLGSLRKLGIMASSDQKEAAWRFVRLLLIRMDGGDISIGIPVLKSSFEELLAESVDEDRNASYRDTAGVDWFTEEDAQRLRELVYGTDKMVHADRALLDIIRGVVSAYLEGYYSEEEATALIQSRAALYVSEQYG